MWKRTSLPLPGFEQVLATIFLASFIDNGVSRRSVLVKGFYEIAISRARVFHNAFSPCFRAKCSRRCKRGTPIECTLRLKCLASTDGGPARGSERDRAIS